MIPVRPPDPDDDALMNALRRIALQEPPTQWRSEILAASAAALPGPLPPWHRRWSFRSLAALWAVISFFWVDAARMNPAPVAQRVVPRSVASPFSATSSEELLFSLNLSNSR